jgi:hypothetical protein
MCRYAAQFPFAQGRRFEDALSQKQPAVEFFGTYPNLFLKYRRVCDIMEENTTRLEGRELCEIRKCLAAISAPTADAWG